MIANLFFGCAMNAQRVNITGSSIESPEVLLCYDALQSTLGVAPILDERPPVEKIGEKPHGIYLLLWNQRIGNYVTGDKDFLDSVGQSVPEQIGRSISRTNCFVETKIISTGLPSFPRGEDLLTVFAKEKVRYVLLARVKHFYGEQRQKAYFYVVPALWVNLFGWGNNADIAVGHTEIDFSLYDLESGDELMREKVVTDADSPVAGNYPKVAKESFFEASEKIANHLYRFAQLQQGSAIITKPE